MGAPVYRARCSIGGNSHRQRQGRLRSKHASGSGVGLGHMNTVAITIGKSIQAEDATVNDFDQGRQIFSQLPEARRAPAVDRSKAD